MTTPTQNSGNLPPLAGAIAPVEPVASESTFIEEDISSTGIDDLLRDLSPEVEEKPIEQSTEVPTQEVAPIAPINPDQVPVTPPVPVETTPPVEPTQAEIIAQLQANQNAMMQQQTQSAQMQQQQIQAQQQAQQPDPNQALYDNYNFDIPTQLSDALNGEDVGMRNQGLVALMKAMAAQVDRTVMEKTNAALSQVPNYMQERLNYQQSIQSAKQDFYSKYPELNNPALADTIQATANEIVPQMGGQWNDQVRDMIANAVKTKVQQLTQVANPQSVGPVAQPPIQSQPNQFIAGGSPTHQMQPPVEDPNRIGNRPQDIAALFNS